LDNSLTLSDVVSGRGAKNPLDHSQTTSNKCLSIVKLLSRAEDSINNPRVCKKFSETISFSRHHRILTPTNSSKTSEERQKIILTNPCNSIS
jgi:hypothetical protein